MNTRSIVGGLLLLLAVGGIVYVLAGDRPPPAQTGSDHGDEAAAGAGAVVPEDGVVVYYFHNHQRCYTCNKMETLAETVVRERFAGHLGDGRVAFAAVNVQTDQGKHFIQDFQLSSAGIVMVERQKGEDLRWRRLDEVWQKIRDEESYRTYIADNLAACLRDLGLEQG
jgi:hypothetical protein